MNEPYRVDLIDYNRYSRPMTNLVDVRGIVVHWTANPDSSANAEMHQRYFNDLEGRYGSAQLFVDREESLLIIPLDEVAYHANDRGGTKVSKLEATKNGYEGGANLTTIGVEMCLESDGSIHPETVERTEDLVKFLMETYGLDTNDVYRHYDITGKNCPAPWVANYSKFANFKKRLNGQTNVVTPSGGVERRDVETVATEVIYGEWGNNPERKEDLLDAGYDYDKVQAEVERQLTEPEPKPEPEPEPEPQLKSVKEVAKEVLNNVWGNNPERKKDLLEAGYDYDKVQAEVERQLEDPEPKDTRKFKLPTSGNYSNRTHGGTFNADVKVIQGALAEVYFYPERDKSNKGVDGYFGPATEDAVRRFQSIYTPSDVDGIVGPNTLAKLDGLANK